MFSSSLTYRPLTPTESSRINALRGALCFQVFCFHYYEAFLKPIRDQIWTGFKILGAQGYLAVLVFFALSGFLISLSYAKESVGNKSRGWRAFYLKRVFRIFPAWFVALLCYFAFFGKTSVLEFLWNFLFLFGFRPFQFSELAAPHAWSLFAEEIFYLSFPLLLLIIRRGWAIYAVGIFVALREIADYLYKTEHGYFVVSPLTNFHYFAVGIAAYFFLPYFRSLPIHRPFFYVLISTVFLVTAYFGTEVPLIWTYISFAFFFVFTAPPEVAKVFNLVFERLGKYCYSFYLMHMLALFNADRVVEWLLAPFAPLSTTEWLLGIFWVSLLMTLMMTLALYHLVERPAIRWAKRRLSRSAAQNETASF